MELIRIFDNNGNNAVSARELHTFLESKQEFSSWIKNRIKKYGFTENQDFEVFDKFIKNPNGGRPLVEYILSIDCAKEISMVEGNEKGKKARQYFIDCEKKSKQKPLSQLEIIAQSAQILLEQDRKLTEISEKQKEMQDKISVLEAKTKTRPDFYTIAGYGTIHGTMVNVTLAAQL